MSGPSSCRGAYARLISQERVEHLRGVAAVEDAGEASLGRHQVVDEPCQLGLRNGFAVRQEQLLAVPVAREVEEQLGGVLRLLGT